jgi:TPR repeat protein
MNKENFYEKLLLLAEEGDPEAQWRIGCLYLLGADGFERDISKAINLFTFSSKENFPQSLFNLGGIYENKDGEFFPGEKPDYIKAFNYHLMAAKLDFPPSMVIVGEYFLYGKGTTQSYKLAKEWLEKGAMFSYQSNLGLILLGKIYFEALGVKKNLVEAHKFFNLGASFNFHHNDDEFTASWYRKQVESLMTFEEIVKAQELAHSFKFLPLPSQFHLKLNDI